MVNEITDELCEDEDIRRLYDLWYESKYAILKSYTKHLPPQKPLSQEETFKPIRNAVIRKALKLSTEQQTEDTTKRVSSSDDTTSSHLPVTAVTCVMKDASRIIEDKINGQLALHPELAVDSKLRREIAAKKRGIQLRM